MRHFFLLQRTCMVKCIFFFFAQLRLIYDRALSKQGRKTLSAEKLGTREVVEGQESSEAVSVLGPSHVVPVLALLCLGLALAAAVAFPAEVALGMLDRWRRRRRASRLPRPRRSRRKRSRRRGSRRRSSAWTMTSTASVVAAGIEEEGGGRRLTPHWGGFALEHQLL